MLPPRSFLLLLCLLSACGAVDKFLEGDIPSKARLLTRLDVNRASLVQGSETTVTATVTRIGGFTGAVTLSVEDLPSGTTGEFGSQSTHDSVTTSVLTLRAAANTPPGGYALKVRGHAEGLTDNVAFLSLEVTFAQSFSLGLSQPSLTVVHGGKGRLTVNLLRSHFSGSVQLALEGPGGIGGSFAANPSSGTSSVLTLTVAPGIAPGSYPLKVRGTAPGLSPQEASLALAVTADPIQVLMSPDLATAQGALANADIIVNRSTYAGPVSLSVENLPAGVSGSLQPAAPLDDSAVLSLTIGPLVPPGSYPVTLRGTGTGVPDATTAFQLVISAANISLALGPGSLSLLPGTSASARLLLSRTAFDGPVAISVAGAPPSLTVVPDATLDGNTGNLVVLASSAVAPGQYDVVVTATPLLAVPPALQSLRSGTQPVFLQQTSVPLTLTVHPLPTGSGNVTVDWSGCALPAWVAYQDGSGSWIQVLPTGEQHRFTVSADRGGYAYVKGDSLLVRYATQAELTAQPLVHCQPAGPTKTVTAFASHFNIPPTNVDPPFSWYLGGGVGTSSPGQPFFSIGGVRPGLHDLIGWGLPANAGARVLLRRDQDPPDGTDLGVLNLRSTVESFAVAQAALTVTGGAGDVVTHGMSYLTAAACDLARLYGTSATSQSDPATITMSGVPAAQQRLSDLHQLSIVANAVGGGASRTRVVTFRPLLARTEVLPPVLPPVAVTSLPGTFKRLEATVGSIPAEFDGLLRLSYKSGPKVVSVSATIAYAGTSDVILAMPDLSGVSGWPATAMATDAAGSWSFSAESVTPGRLCAEGRILASAARLGTF